MRWGIYSAPAAGKTRQRLGNSDAFLSKTWVHQSGTYMSVIIAEKENAVCFNLIPFHLITIIHSPDADILPLSHTMYHCQ